jgi:hypothetical protein
VRFVDTSFEIDDTEIVFLEVPLESLILQSKGRKKPIKEVTLDLVVTKKYLLKSGQREKHTEEKRLVLPILPR